MRAMVRDEYLITSYYKTNRYEGNEGELYSLSQDPNQRRNLWDTPRVGHVEIRSTSGYERSCTRRAG